MYIYHTKEGSTFGIIEAFFPFLDYDCASLTLKRILNYISPFVWCVCALYTSFMSGVANLQYFTSFINFNYFHVFVYTFLVLQNIKAHRRFSKTLIPTNKIVGSGIQPIQNTRTSGFTFSLFPFSLFSIHFHHHSSSKLKDLIIRFSFQIIESN